MCNCFSLPPSIKHKLHYSDNYIKIKLTELIGKRCEIIFNLPPSISPANNYPAIYKILAIDMPMIKLSEYYGNNEFWFNISNIQKISKW